MSYTSISHNLLQWFTRQQRQLPWRVDYQPYHVWISEIMLQQTQMERVVPFFLRWIDRFPTIEAVAKAPEDDIHKAWEGLGYYSRVKNIATCARQLMAQGGVLPADFHSLLELPGIGPYTAGAIMSIAFQQPYPVVDANVKRVFSRLFNISTPLSSQKFKDRCLTIAHRMVQKANPRDLNQSLMELGALICLASTPQCGQCPVQPMCQSYQKKIVHLRPRKGKTVQRIPISVVAGVIEHKGTIYIQKRLATSRWANLWEFPGGHLKPGESPEDGVVREVLEETEFSIQNIQPLPVLEHSFTQYRYFLHAFSCTLADQSPTPTLHAAQDYRWLPLAELDDYAFSAGHRKLLNFLLQKSP